MHLCIHNNHKSFHNQQILPYFNNHKSFHNQQILPYFSPKTNDQGSHNFPIMENKDLTRTTYKDPLHSYKTPLPGQLTRTPFTLTLQSPFTPLFLTQPTIIIRWSPVFTQLQLFPPTPPPPSSWWNTVTYFMQVISQLFVIFVHCLYMEDLMVNSLPMSTKCCYFPHSSKSELNTANYTICTVLA